MLFIIALFGSFLLGCIVGVVITCLCVASGRVSHAETTTDDCNEMRQ